MMVGDTRIGVSVYSPEGTMTATELLGEVDSIFPAASRYLGGDLPVQQYSILVYLARAGSGSGGFGALEHNTSTVFVLPEAPIAALSQTIKNVTAHEFFHIVTPLNIHSEEIDDYDFMNPQMSKHLWLYEGCTEYAAQHVQVKEADMPLKEFLDVMRNKMVAADNYNTGIAFTELSKKALGEHSNQYANVYQKGALIGMALDLKLRSLSDGAYGTQNLMDDLAEAYGPETPFQDDSLFNEIARVSNYPEVKPFLEKYVGGSAPLPFDSLLQNVGVFYSDSTTEEVVSGGNVSIGYNPKTEKMVVVGLQEMDEFAKDLGFEQNDELISWDGSDITLENARDVINAFKQNVEAGEKVKVVVNRKKDNGKYKKKKLKARTVATKQTRRHVLEVMDDPEPEQLELRKAWVKK
jgi:predicted metalloprotease with PDZ domain